MADYHIPYTDGEERVEVKTKCPTCKAITEQEAIRIIPMNPEADPMETLKLAKRLVMCRTCGTQRLIN